MFDNKYPYTDNHELNLDWMINNIKHLLNQIDFINKLTSKLGTDIGSTSHKVEELESSKQNKLTAGDNIIIEGDVISAIGGTGGVTKEYVDAQNASQNVQIGNNSTAIATNTAAIAENTTSIAENATAIAENTTAIATNTANIATNTANINSHDTRIYNLEHPTTKTVTLTNEAIISCGMFAGNKKDIYFTIPALNDVTYSSINITSLSSMYIRQNGNNLMTNIEPISAADWTVTPTYTKLGVQIKMSHNTDITNATTYSPCVLTYKLNGTATLNN